MGGNTAFNEDFLVRVAQDAIKDPSKHLTALYQPLRQMTPTGLRSPHPHGYEALLRVCHQGMAVPPDQLFMGIPTEHCAELEAAALVRQFEGADRLPRDNGSVRMSVNVSAPSLQRAPVQEALPGRPDFIDLTIEITEHNLPNDVRVVAWLIEHTQQTFDCQVMLDDITDTTRGLNWVGNLSLRGARPDGIKLPTASTPTLGAALSIVDRAENDSQAPIQLVVEKIKNAEMVDSVARTLSRYGKGLASHVFGQGFAWTNVVGPRSEEHLAHSETISDGWSQMALDISV